MQYPTIDNATLLAWYGEALNALHQLRTGAKIASASYSQGTGARGVTYTQADRDDLIRYIAQLESALAQRGLLADSTKPRRRAIGIRY